MPGLIIRLQSAQVVFLLPAKSLIGFMQLSDIFPYPKDSPAFDPCPVAFSPFDHLQDNIPK